jgi:hypothetical protein
VTGWRFTILFALSLLLFVLGVRYDLRATPGKCAEFGTVVKIVEILPDVG